MSKLDILMSKAKSYVMGVAAAGKKNAPSLMTGGSIILGWTAVYIFWKKSRDAEKRIEYEESKLNADLDCDTPLTELKHLSKKEKFIIYLQYCWLSGLMGIASTGLAIGANSINVSRITELVLLTKFMNDKDEKQKDLIERLKQETGEKRFLELEKEMRDEEYPKDEVLEAIKTAPGKGTTLFIDRVTGAKFKGNIMTVKDGIADFNRELKRRWERQMKTERGNYIRQLTSDPFFSAENKAYLNEEDIEKDMYRTVYSSLSAEEFLYYIREIDTNVDVTIGDLLEIRCYGEDEPVKESDILKYKQYEDPETGIPMVCFIDYRDLLKPTEELIARTELDS